MSKFKSYSQAGQDRLVYELLVKPDNLLTGTFIDIGACHPIEISNTYALEQLGWHGLLIDNDPGSVALCLQHRTSPTILGDATTLNWRKTLDRFGMPAVISFLSLDIDAATLPALQNLMRANPSFRVITAEHDSYRFGTERRNAMRLILLNAGYDLVCADVCSVEGLPYEDWWVAPELSRRADPFRCVNKKWTEIIPA